MVNYGLRYDTAFGLFIGSGRSQIYNPALSTGLVDGIPHDYRKAFAPRLGIAKTVGSSQKTVIRSGVGTSGSTSRARNFPHTTISGSPAAALENCSQTATPSPATEFPFLRISFT